MSFHTTSATGGGELYDLVFNQILQVRDCVGGNTYGCLTGELQTDFIFALFIPHVILLVYLLLITRSVFVFRQHTGISTMFGIAVYVFLVFTGWYGFLATFLVWWIALTIIVSLGYFLLSAVISPTDTEARFRLGQQLKGKYEDAKSNEEARRELRKYLKSLEKRRSQAEKELDDADNDAVKAKIREQINAIDQTISETERKLKKLR